MKELKVSFIQSSDKDDATHCRVSSWSRYPPCTREDTGSRLFHFRTRTPLDPKQYLLAEECRRFRESRGEEFVHVSLCNHTNKGLGFTKTMKTHRTNDSCYANNSCIANMSCKEKSQLKTFQTFMLKLAFGEPVKECLFPSVRLSLIVCSSLGQPMRVFSYLNLSASK